MDVFYAGRENNTGLIDCLIDFRAGDPALRVFTVWNSDLRILGGTLAKHKNRPTHIAAAD